jgi:hypothetical protein
MRVAINSRAMAVGLNQMRLGMPQAKLSKCKHVVEWLIAEWNRNSELKSYGEITSYTGGLFEPGDLGQGAEFHNLAVIKAKYAFFILDMAIQQFIPQKKWLVMKTLPGEGKLIEVLKDFYGGSWWNF